MEREKVEDVGELSGSGAATRLDYIYYLRYTGIQRYLMTLAGKYSITNTGLVPLNFRMLFDRLGGRFHWSSPLVVAFICFIQSIVDLQSWLVIMIQMSNRTRLIFVP